MGDPYEETRGLVPFWFHDDYPGEWLPALCGPSNLEIAGWIPNHTQIGLMRRENPNVQSTFAARTVWLEARIAGKIGQEPEAAGRAWRFGSPVHSTDRARSRHTIFAFEDPVGLVDDRLNRACVAASLEAGADIVALPPELKTDARTAMARAEFLNERTVVRSFGSEIAVSMAISDRADAREVTRAMELGCQHLVLFTYHGTGFMDALAAVQVARERHGADAKIFIIGQGQGLTGHASPALTATLYGASGFVPRSRRPMAAAYAKKGRQEILSLDRKAQVATWQASAQHLPVYCSPQGGFRRLDEAQGHPSTSIESEDDYVREKGFQWRTGLQSQHLDLYRLLKARDPWAAARERHEFIRNRMF